MWGEMIWGEMNAHRLQHRVHLCVSETINYLKMHSRSYLLSLKAFATDFLDLSKTVDIFK